MSEVLLNPSKTILEAQINPILSFPGPIRLVDEPDRSIFDHVLLYLNHHPEGEWWRCDCPG
jgi:hypothetical protein